MLRVLCVAKQKTVYTEVTEEAEEAEEAEDSTS